MKRRSNHAMPYNTDLQRKCHYCMEIKPLIVENFHRDKSREHGFGYECRPCAKIRSKTKPRRIRRHAILTLDARRRKAASNRTYQRKFGQTPKGKASRLLHSYNRTDRLSGRTCDLTKTWLLENIVNQPCHYCGETSLSTGCDRVDNSIGHIMENIVPCCPACNAIRADRFTASEMKAIGSTIRKIKMLRWAEAHAKDVAPRKSDLSPQGTEPTFSNLA